MNITFTNKPQPKLPPHLEELVARMEADGFMERHFERAGIRYTEVTE
jgi:hypothetical protein